MTKATPYFATGIRNGRSQVRGQFAFPEAEIIVNVSNDAWFGDSLAPHQHLEMARMRARETERYVLRATNTGISAIIDANGALLVRSRQFESVTVSGDVQPRAGATPYVLWGNWPVVLASLAVFLLAGRIPTASPV